MEHETITNCFHKSGFGTLAESLEGTVKEPVLPEVTNVDGYLNIDKDLQCFEESNSNYDDDIIEGIISKRACLKDSSEDDDVISQPMISNALTRESIQNLHRYFIEQVFDDAAQKSLDTCTEVIYRRFGSRRKQSTIDNYFS